MNNFEAINKRKSTRKFVNKKLDDEILMNIKDIINDINEESGLTIKLIKNGESAFEFIEKNYGTFNNVKSVILLKGPAEKLDLEEKVGFFGEKLCIELVKMNIDNCWVAGSYDKERYRNYIEYNEELICVMPIGVGAEGIVEHIAEILKNKNNRELESFYDADKDIPKWLEEGIIAVQKAPSSKNKQPVRVKYENDEVSIYLEEGNKHMLVDLGIAKANFVMCTDGSFDCGDNVKYIKKNSDNVNTMISIEV